MYAVLKQFLLKADVITWPSSCTSKSQTDIPLYSCTEIGYGFSRPEVIGDFPEEEARQFFTEQAIPLSKYEVELSEDDWAKVWQV